MGIAGVGTLGGRDRDLPLDELDDDAVLGGRMASGKHLQARDRGEHQRRA